MWKSTDTCAMCAVTTVYVPQNSVFKGLALTEPHTVHSVTPGLKNKCTRSETPFNTTHSAFEPFGADPWKRHQRHLQPGRKGLLPSLCLLSPHHLFLEARPHRCWLPTMCLQALCPQDSTLAPFHVPSEDAKQLVF